MVFDAVYQKKRDTNVSPVIIKIYVPTLALSKSGIWVEVLNFLSACTQAPRVLSTCLSIETPARNVNSFFLISDFFRNNYFYSFYLLSKVIFRTIFLLISCYQYILLPDDRTIFTSPAYHNHISIISIIVFTYFYHSCIIYSDENMKGSALL